MESFTDRLAAARELAMAKAATKATRKGFRRTAYANTFGKV